MKNSKKITAIILAGGKSSRMGRDKGSLILNGSSFLRRIIEVVKPIVNDIIIVSNNPGHDMMDCIRVNDHIENSGPLAGLYAGLFHSTTPFNLVLSCDIPFIKTSILEQLINQIDDDNDVVQIESHGKTMPLIAVYKKECMYECLKLLNIGERRLRVAVKQFKTKNIPLHASLDRYISNVNTTQQLNQLKHEFDN
jgi:molybdopterin-guanine dinucleotide biosynthesis protein A